MPTRTRTPTAAEDLTPEARESLARFFGWLTPEVLTSAPEYQRVMEANWVNGGRNPCIACGMGAVKPP